MEEGISYNWFDPSLAFGSDMQFFSCFGGIVFAFGTPVGALPVFKDLTDNTRKRIRKVYNRSIISEFIIFFSFGLSGYLTAPIDTPIMIIDRTTIFANDIILSIGKTAFLIAIMIAFAVNFICCKISIINLTCNSPEEFTTKRNFIVTLISLVGITSLACLYAKVNDYLDFLGGLIAVTLSFLIPTLLHLKVTTKSWTHWRVVIPIIMGFIICFLGYSGAIMVLIKIISGKSS